MREVRVIGLDLAKHVFEVHGVDAAGQAGIRKRLRRAQVLEVFGRQPASVVAMEACTGAHVWGREIDRFGHEVRLIPPASVKPFVKRQESDAADAEAVCEVSSRWRSKPAIRGIASRRRRQRPTMRLKAVKSEGRPAAAVVSRSRDLLVRQGTQLIDALRGRMGEFGVVGPQGAARAKGRIARVADPETVVPEAARSTLQALASALDRLEAEIQGLEAEIVHRAKGDVTARRPMTLPRGDR